MAEVIETIDVDVPVRTAYDQCMQFQDFPFMDGVERVVQVDDTHLLYGGRDRRAAGDVGGRDHGRAPPRRACRVEGHGRQGARAGVVTFHRS